MLSAARVTARTPAREPLDEDQRWPATIWWSAMPDMCLCRWVAFGTIPEVQRFVRAARSKRPKTVRGRRRASAEPLSFQQLWPLGPDDDPSDRYATPSTEPDDCSTTGVKRTGTTAARVSYSFLTIWGEPYELVRHVSTQFPRLDFVLGAVAPAVGEANSWYFRAGRGKNWVMGGRRHEQMYRQTYAAAGVDPEDDYIDPGLEYGLDIRFDHALMQEVVAQWTVVRRAAARRKRR